MKRAIIYARVSTKGQEDDGTSLDSQVAACQEYASKHGFEVARITRETYTGGELWDRPKLAQDRADLKSGEFQALIVYAIDRLARDPVHVAIVNEECERAGVELIFVTEPLDASPEGALIRYVKGYAAKIEREKIRERSLRGKRTRAESGKVPGAGVELYGYRRDKGRGVRIIYEPEAIIVRRIFEWCAGGASIKEIIRRLNEQHIPPPSAGKISYPEPERIPKWSNGTLNRILRNPAYKGEGVAWRWKHHKNKMPSIRPEDEWIRLPEGTVPAIVPVATWDVVQERLSLNMNMSSSNKAKALRYLLRGLVFCAVCGRRMYSEPADGRRVYRCSSRQRAAVCGAKQVPAGDLESWAWEQIDAVLRDPSIIAAELQRRQENGPDPVLSADLETAQRALTRIAKQQERLVNAFSASDDDAFPWELVQKKIGDLEREKEQYQQSIMEIEQRLAVQEQTTNQMQTLHAYCAKVGANLDSFDFDDKRLAFEAFGVKIKANGREWELEGTIPLEDGILYQTC